MILFHLVLLLFVGYSIPCVQAQTSAQQCESEIIEDMEFAANAVVYVDPDTGGSSISAGEMMIIRGGYYRIFTKVNYNSGDTQRNESFYVFLVSAKGDTITPVDANAGPYKVVQDVVGPEKRIWQDAGSFRLPAGVNGMTMCHYAKIAVQYPDFLDGPIDGKESVYVDSIRMVYEPAIDGEIRLKAVVKDSVQIENQSYGLLSPGETVTYRIAIKNAQQDSLYGATMVARLADSLTATEYSMQPKEVDDNVLTWSLPPIAGRATLLLSFQARLTETMPAGFTLLPTKVVLEAPCDYDLANNSAQADIYAFADTSKVEPRFADVAVHISAVLDSIQVTDAGDSLYYASPDSLATFRIQLKNLGPDSAENVRLVNFFSQHALIDSFSIAPDTVESDTLKWQWPAFPPDTSIRITYRTKMPGANPGKNLQFMNTARIFAENDTVPANNIDQIIVLVSKIKEDSTGIEISLADIAVRQFAETDSVTVRGLDTLRFVHAGETYRRTIVIANVSDMVASNVVLQSFYSVFVKPHSFSLYPNANYSTSLSWEIPAMQPGEIVRIGYKEIVLPELSPNIRLLINETKAAAENEDPLKLANNIAIDTIYAYSAITTYPIAAQPGIEASPSVVDIGQPVSLRVRFPKEPASWDIWAYFADGRIDSAFADQTIAWLPAPPVDAWQPLPEIFTNTRLVTEARREHITFEMRVVDRDGLFAKNAVDVVVQSTNAFTLERNVFEPDLHALNIRFKLSSNRTARLDVYNLAGQHVTKLAEQPYNAGWHSQRWDGRTEGGEQVVSGVYLITIRSGDFNAWKRCILVR